MENMQCDLGMVGLGTMGRNLALNMTDHGYAIAGYDLDPEKMALFHKEAAPHPVRTGGNIKEFIDCLKTPHVVMLLAPAGPPVDAAIRGLLEYLQPGDIIIDGGNSHFIDTELRQKTLAAKGIQFLGFGISGGAKGAREGPSIMPGGPREAWEKVRRIFEAVAARVRGEPCVAWMGPGGAGHYVKMVHNGIEYGLMELIAECYDIMRRGLKMSDDGMHDVFKDWAQSKQSEVGGFLVEITAEILLKTDELTGKRLINVISDAARQKGTGIWTSQEAMDLHVPIPTIDIAVAMRDLSALVAERESAARVLRGPMDHLDANPRMLVQDLHDAFHAAMILTYAQGFALLRAASEQRQYGIELETVARIWRGGCIIRSNMLETIAETLLTAPVSPLLFLTGKLHDQLLHHQADLRRVSCIAGDIGIPAPAFAVSLAYYDAWRSPSLPDNLIQAQRDYFGAHTYERNDRRGTFHTEWA